MDTDFIEKFNTHAFGLVESTKKFANLLETISKQEQGLEFISLMAQIEIDPSFKLNETQKQVVLKFMENNQAYDEVRKEIATISQDLNSLFQQYAVPLQESVRLFDCHESKQDFQDVNKRIAELQQQALEASP